MENLSVIIPCYNDKDIQRTVDDIRAKAKGDIEIIVVLDGIHQVVKNSIVLENEKQVGMRASINKGVKRSTGKWLMKCDAHCVFDKGFDEKVLSEIEKDWIVIPRRYKLDTDKWEIMDEPPIDYEKLYLDNPDKIGELIGPGGKTIKKIIAETGAGQHGVATATVAANSVFEEEIAALDKPEDMKAKILAGKLDAYFKEMTLMNQSFIKNPEIKIEKLLANYNAKLIEYKSAFLG